MEPLPPLPLEPWEPTKNTLHLWVQIVGKVKMASLPSRNHWWHVPLYVDVRGLTTHLLHAADGSPFEIRFDLLDHELVVETPTERRTIELRDGLSVADFDRRLHEALGDLDVQILEKPFGVPAFTTPFPEDREHATYDPEAVERFWRVLDWSDGLFDEFSSWFCGKQSPVHLFWHSLDLAVTRFSGKRATTLPEADAVTNEAYTHELVSFGFWAGDANLREPAYYSYTFPEPDALRERPLAPAQARWTEQGAGSLAILPYEAVRTAPDPRQTLLEFLESAYEAGADAAGWDRAGLMSTWCPIPA